MRRNLPETIFRGLVTKSETTIAVWGTLLLSLGVNLLTNLNTMHLRRPGYTDLFMTSGATASILWGFLVFRFVERCRILDRVLENEEDLLKRNDAREDFIRDQLELGSTKKLLKTIKASLWFLLLPALLAVGRVVVKIPD